MSWLGLWTDPHEEQHKQVRYALFHNTHTAMERVVYRAATLSSPNTAKRTAGSMQYVLTDRDADVLALVQAIEDCLFHGLKKPEDQPSHCWHLLEALSRVNSAFAPTILAIGMCTKIHTQRGLCRAWIRKALNQNCLHYCLETLLSKATHKLRTSAYDPYAFTRDEEAAAVFCKLLKPLDSLPCDLTFDSERLDVLRALDPDDAMAHSRKIKFDMESLDIVLTCTSCGVPGAVGSYVVTFPIMTKTAVSRRMEKSAYGDGGGRELARFKHSSGPFCLVCCTPAIPITAVDPSLSKDVERGSHVLWSLIDEHRKTLYFVELEVGVPSGSPASEFPPIRLIPPDCGWVPAVDDGGNPYAPVPAPEFTVVVRNPPDQPSIVKQVSELLSPSKASPPAAAAASEDPAGGSGGWSAAKADVVVQEEPEGHPPPAVLSPVGGIAFVDDADDAAAPPTLVTEDEDPLADQKSQRSHRSRRSRASSKSGVNAAASVLSGGSAYGYTPAVTMSHMPPIPATPSGASAWSVRALESRRALALERSGEGIRKPTPAVKSAPAIPIELNPSGPGVVRKPSSVKVKRPHNRLNKSASAALEQRGTLLDASDASRASPVLSPTSADGPVLGDLAHMANTSISSLNSEEMQGLSSSLAPAAVDKNESVLSTNTVVERRRSSVESSGAMLPLQLPQQPGGSPGVAEEDAAGLPSSQPAVAPLSSSSLVTDSNTNSSTRHSPAGDEPSVVIVAVDVLPSPTRAPVDSTPFSTPTKSSMSHVVIASPAVSTPDPEQPVTLAPVVASSVPLVMPHTPVKPQHTPVSPLSPQATDDVPLDSRTAKFADERKRLMEKLTRSQSRSQSRPQPAVGRSKSTIHPATASTLATESPRRVVPSPNIPAVDKVPPGLLRSKSVLPQRGSVAPSVLPPPAVGVTTGPELSRAPSRLSSRPKSRSRARLDVLEHVPAPVLTRQTDDDSEGSLGGAASDAPLPPVQNSDVFYAPVRHKGAAAEPSASRSASVRSMGPGRSVSRSQSARDAVSALDRSYLSPDDSIMRVVSAVMSPPRERPPPTIDVGEEKEEERTEQRAPKASPHPKPAPVVMIEDYWTEAYQRRKRNQQHTKANAQQASPNPASPAAPVPLPAPRIVNQIDVNDSLLYKKLELCDITARVTRYRLAKSKGSEYAEYAVTVYMLEEAYTRLSMACKAPIVQGDVPCFTLYYRYSKFNRFNDQMMEEFPDAKLPTLPGVSLFQHIDTKFLQGRLSKLQAYMDGLLSLRRTRFRAAPRINGVAGFDISTSMTLARFLQCVPRDALVRQTFEVEYYSDVHSALKMVHSCKTSAARGRANVASPVESVPSHFSSTTSSNPVPVSHHSEKPHVYERSLSVTPQTAAAAQLLERSESARRPAAGHNSTGFDYSRRSDAGRSMSTMRLRESRRALSRNVFSPEDPIDNPSVDVSSVGDHDGTYHTLPEPQLSFLQGRSGSFASSHDDNNHDAMSTGEGSDVHGSVFSVDDGIGAQGVLLLRQLTMTGVKFDRSSAERGNKRDMMRRQEGKCAQCGAALKLGLLSAGYALCEYDNHLCCKNCHVGDLRVIPARAVWKWDLEPAPVCKSSAAMLDKIKDAPIVCLSTINSKLFETEKALAELRNLRIMLVRMKPYIVQCASQGKLLRLMAPKLYYMETAEMWSLSDLCKVSSGAMTATLSDLVETYQRHITVDCEACLSRALRCHICESSAPMFEFDVEHVRACKEYLHFFHKTCLRTVHDACPMCAEALDSSVSGTDTSMRQRARKYAAGYQHQSTLDTSFGSGASITRQRVRRRTLSHSSQAEGVPIGVTTEAVVHPPRQPSASSSYSRNPSVVAPAVAAMQTPSPRGDASSSFMSSEAQTVKKLPPRGASTRV